MKRLLLITAGLLSAIACTSQHKNSSRGPSSDNVTDGLQWKSTSENDTLWNKYCVGKARSADVPQPNYNNALVKDTAAKFKNVASNSLYLYPVIVNAYKIKSMTPPAGIDKDAHAFLVYLCGEFRDRATMVEAKLLWLTNFNKLVPGKQPGIAAGDTTNVWKKMTAESYRPFLNYSHDLWFAREAQIPKITMGQYVEPGAVDGLSVCTTKFIFNEISNGRGFKDLASHNKAFDAYASGCPQVDKEDYYDFRGDSNFKPNSPESNGMIWYANHIAANCASTTKARPTEAGATVTNPANVVTDAVCADYFQNPFRRRWQAARAGLSAWMMHDKKYDKDFKDDYSAIVIWPHRLKDAQNTMKPFAYKVPTEEGQYTDPLEQWLEGFEPSHWNNNDFNFNLISGLGMAKPDQPFVFERLRDAMNRHTNWYQSKWDDGLGGKNSFKNQAYSPFVASSYEPSESDQFTFCGITVPCPPDGFKHWMFVFRIKGDNWYRVDDIATNATLDFSYNWFDETSLGTTSLADKEHAWDRLGTALEEELMGGAVLYLHNITDGGEVSNDNLVKN